MSRSKLPPTPVVQTKLAHLSQMNCAIILVINFVIQWTQGLIPSHVFIKNVSKQKYWRAY